MMKDILIIGLGEIGKAFKQIEGDFNNNIEFIDINNNTSTLKSYDVCHICIPYSDRFEEIIKKYLTDLDITITFIHSTVRIETTNKLVKRLKKDIVHSPCMGIHPFLYKSIKTFVKIIGGEGKSLELAKNHLDSINIKHSEMSSRGSETAKLLSTTYYGELIRFMQDVHLYCENNNLDFDEVYTKTNEIYNEGYKKMEMDYVVRPILKWQGQGISGHCIISNCLILHQSDNNFSLAKEVGSVGYIIPENIKGLPNYQYKDWLFAEYIGKEKSSTFIGEECGVSSVTIRNWLKNFNIPVRSYKWLEEEDKILIELSQEMTFKEIAENSQINKTYSQIRNRAYHTLKLKSVYDPSIRSEETRKKISCTLRDMDYNDFNVFTTKEYEKLRRNSKYLNWRKAVLEKYDYICQKSGVKGGRLNVHHIVPWNTNEKLRFDTENGIVLSEKYHIKFHKKYGYKECGRMELEEFLKSNVI